MKIYSIWGRPVLIDIPGMRDGRGSLFAGNG
jgi:hypothetical protein